MKKIFIYLFLCVLWVNSMGQGTAHITQSNFNVNAQIIRQYGNQPGSHVICFTDLASRWIGYVGLTTMYNYIIYSKLVSGSIINDLEILGNYAYFCGQTALNEALIGWFDINQLAMGNGASPYIDYSFHAVSGLTSIDNVDVYLDALGNPIVVGYGTDGTRNYGIKYDVSSSSYETAPLSFTPYDLTMTNNFIVYAGIDGSGATRCIILHPFQKNGAFALSPVPYFSYTAGSATAIEPLADLRIVHHSNDIVSTLSYRFEGGAFSMMLREYDLMNASSSIAPNTSTYQVKFNYSVNRIFDFRYNAANNMYTVLHNYEISPYNYHDAATKIDFGGGTPSTVQSDYISSPTLGMRSLSLSDSTMYAVYGNNVGNELLFWKDFQSATGMGPCLNTDVLPIYSGTPLPYLPNSCSRGGLWTGVQPTPVTYDPETVSIFTLCR